MPDIKGNNMLNTTFQKNLSETAGGCTNVERTSPTNIQITSVESSDELVSCATDVVIETLDRNLVGVTNFVCGLDNRLAVNTNEPLVEKFLRVRARASKSAPSQSGVETLIAHEDRPLLGNVIAFEATAQVFIKRGIALSTLVKRLCFDNRQRRNERTFVGSVLGCRCLIHTLKTTAKAEVANLSLNEKNLSR